MPDAIEKDIIGDLASLTNGSDPDGPSTPSVHTKPESPGAESLFRHPERAPIPFPCSSEAVPVPGIPAHLPQPTAPPIDEVMSGLFPGENGDLSSELAAVLADCAGTKLDGDKLVAEADPLDTYEGGHDHDVVMCEGIDAEDQNANGFLDMASFLEESEDTKQNVGNLGMEAADGGMTMDLGLNDPSGGFPPQGEGMAGVEESSVAGNSGAGAVAMGVPYYVACNWQMQQQQQQQQQHAAMMLWWQAYLSSCGGLFGQPGGMPPSFPGPSAGWGMPLPGMQFPPGLFPQPPGAEALFPQLMNAGTSTALGHKTAGAGCQNGPTKRRRRQDSSGGGSGNGQGDLSSLNSSNRKGRRPKQEERVCKNCGTHATPFWRKDRNDGLPLCNACGLYLSKNDAPRPKVLWKSSDPSGIVATDSNTTCL